MNNNFSNPLKYKNYFSFLYQTTKKHGVVLFFKNIYSFLRKYILVGRIFRYARVIFIWVQTGAYFVLVWTFLAFLIPLILISLLLFLLYTHSMHKRANKHFSKLIRENDFCIIFKNNENEIKSECEDCSVHIYVIVDPFTKMTACVTKSGKKDYLISLNYFYSLKKNVLDKEKNKVFYN